LGIKTDILLLFLTFHCSLKRQENKEEDKERRDDVREKIGVYSCIYVGQYFSKGEGGQTQYSHKRVRGPGVLPPCTKPL